MNPWEDLDAGRGAAIGVLRRSAADAGFVASADDAHYTSLWARDAAFSILGAVASGEPDLVEASARSLRTLARIQAPSGQIPDAYWPNLDYWDFGEAGSSDASALFAVAAREHLRRHPDAALQAELLPHITRAVAWLATQDANGFGLIDSPLAGDWMDSSFCRSGKVLYVNVVYRAALTGAAELAPDGTARGEYERRGDELARAINHLFWPEPGAEYAAVLTPALGDRATRFPHPASPAAFAEAARPDREHYLSHVQWGRFVDECDTLGNILAVLESVASPARSARILRHIASRAGSPFPVRTYTRSFPADDRWGMYSAEADRHQGQRWRNPPGSYHNGAVWPFIGGLYVTALQRCGMETEARSELMRLAHANWLAAPAADPWGFHEWLHADTGAPEGPRGQTWSAGCFVLALESLGL